MLFDLSYRTPALLCFPLLYYFFNIFARLTLISGSLVIFKTFNGLYVQKAILASLAEKQCTTYRLATPSEEAVGIDGYVGNIAYSVKPDTYKTMGRLSETIDVKMIYYTKTKTGLKIEVED